MKKDITNQIFGNLKVIEFIGNLPVGTQGKRRGKWECKCICGKNCQVFTGDLVSGKTKSCGCFGRIIGNKIRCSKCRIYLEKDNFTKDGYYCKKCASEERKRRYDPIKVSENYYKNLTEERKIKIRGYSKKYRDKDPEKYNEKTRKWRSENPNYKKHRWKTDLKFRITENLRGRLYKALKNNSKSSKTIDLLGCDILELKDYIENLFTEGMSWNNYGEWHIDHIKPCSLFDLAIESQQKECFNYKNLQPLWAKDNLKKSNKYD